MTSEEFEITIKLTGTKQDAEEAVKYLRKLQWSFTHNVPEPLRESDIYLQDETRTFIALEKNN